MVALQKIVSTHVLSILTTPKTCTVEIVSIGNELLLGNTINTNASWIATRITAEGGRVNRITVVEDNLNEIARVIRETLSRKPNYIITTGGIGPTFDDMTIESVARSLRQPLQLNPEARVMIKDHYSKSLSNKNVKLTKARLKMAMLPIHATAVPNPIGTAPAVRLKAGTTVIFCLPGVPREAKAIFKETIASQIHLGSGEKKFVERWIKVTGIMESTLAPVVERTMKRWPHVYVKSHPRGFKQNAPIIDLHLSTLSPTPHKARREILAASEFLIQKLPDLKGRVNRVS